MDNYILLKNLEVEKINKYIKTLNKISIAFKKLSDEVGENKKNICDSIVIECNDIVKFLDKIAEKV